MNNNEMCGCDTEENISSAKGIVKINYKEDFELVVELLAGDKPYQLGDEDFRIDFIVMASRYTVGRTAGMCERCMVVDGNKVRCFMDGHGLPPGELRAEVKVNTPDPNYADGKRLNVAMAEGVVVLVKDNTRFDGAVIKANIPVVLVDAYQLAKAHGYKGTIDEYYATFTDVSQLKENIKGTLDEMAEAERQRADAEKERAKAETERQSNRDRFNTAESERVKDEQQRQTAEGQRQKAENDRTTAESNRASAEEQRVKTEQQRSRTEEARQTAESQRANDERARVGSEIERAKAETQRQTAEEQRKQAEEDRQKSQDRLNAAEEERKQAEADRQKNRNRFNAAEDARVDAEKQRNDTEQARKTAETQRQTNEDARMKAEKERATAEGKRAETDKERDELVAKMQAACKEIEQMTTVNDLTTGGATRALSAEMGKRLQELINQRAAAVHGANHAEGGSDSLEGLDLSHGKWSSAKAKKALDTLGDVAWSDDDTLQVQQEGTSIDLGFSHNAKVINATTSTIAKGTAVMMAGTVDNGGKITVKPYDGTGNVIGVAATAITANSIGIAKITGRLRGYNTSSFTEQQILYVGSNGLPTPTPSKYVYGVVVSVGTSGNIDLGVRLNSLTSEDINGVYTLNYATDSATTRLQVSKGIRKVGMIISYNDGNKWVNEQFVGSATDDESWGNDKNWERECSSKYTYIYDTTCDEYELNGYYTLAGDRVISPWFSTYKIPVADYIGMKYDMQGSPLIGQAGDSVFVFEDGTTKSVRKKTGEVPENATYMLASFGKGTTPENNKVLFSTTKMMNDAALRENVYTKKEVDRYFIGRDALKKEYTLQESSDYQIGYTNSNGVLTINSDYCSANIDVRGWIGAEVQINKPYTSGDASTTGFEFSDGTKKTINVVSGKFNKFTVPENAVRMWSTFLANTEDKSVYLILYDYNVASKVYVDEKASNAEANANQYTDNRFVSAGIGSLPSNTIWYVLGDSITAESVASGQHYFNLIAARNNIPMNQVVSLARDGAKLAYSTAYGGTQLSKLSLIPTDTTTLVTILLGINDFQQNSPQIALGTPWKDANNLIDVPATIQDCVTFSQAEVYLIDYLTKNLKKATIVQILPLRRRGMVTNSEGKYLDEFWKVIEDVCGKYSVPVIKMGKDSTLLNPNLKTSTGLFNDAVHPGKAGNIVMSYYLEKHLSLIVPTVEVAISWVMSGNVKDANGKLLDLSLTFTSDSGAVFNTSAGYGGAYSANLDDNTYYKITCAGYSCNPSTIKLTANLIQDIVLTAL